MAFILNIETATEVCSAALAVDGKLLALEEDTNPNTHSSVLTLLIDKLFKITDTSMDDLDAVAVSEGPGSFTGLRIGVSTAKGLCYALDLPLIAVPTLKAMACSAVEQAKNTEALYCPVLESVKGEVFAALYSAGLEEIASPSPCSADLVDLARLSGHKMTFVFGPGLSKAQLPETMHPLLVSNSSKYMSTLSESLFIENIFQQVDYFEPRYLKNFLPRAT